LASRQGFGELKPEQLGGHSQEQQRHRQAPIDDDDYHPWFYIHKLYLEKPDYVHIAHLHCSSSGELNKIYETVLNVLSMFMIDRF